ncbi:hypothetical protein [Bacillus salipaludis]|uniref:hypothetical protein n=1 Tax=Bacillus salipaludis TaxID=2547811 RepID=UPI002E24C898|nr:hypothetical protein [Bacillus salipaludis]
MFLGMLKSFVGKVINIDRGGRGSKVGKLLDVNNDYFALLTEKDGVVYYNTQHIKSVTENTKGYNIVFPEDFEYKKANNLLSLLENQKLQWIKINHDGPEKIEGILYDVNNDIISLIFNDEIVRIPMFHLRTIRMG